MDVCSVPRLPTRVWAPKAEAKESAEAHGGESGSSGIRRCAGRSVLQAFNEREAATSPFFR